MSSQPLEIDIEPFGPDQKNTGKRIQRGGDGEQLWRFLVVRPAASSGTNGSAIELRFVGYRGKCVLYRAHVPILNVKYHNGACGPFRDWQNEEGMIQASGTELAPGILRCPQPAKTIFDTGADTGNFLGMAVYEENGETVLVSEMQAGWLYEPMAPDR